MAPASTPSFPAKIVSPTVASEFTILVTVGVPLSVVLLLLLFLVILILLVRYRRRNSVAHVSTDAPVVKVVSNASTIIKEDFPSPLGFDKSWKWPRGNIQLLRRLGEGMFGAVYEAAAVSPKGAQSTKVAVKVEKRSICDAAGGSGLLVEADNMRRAGMNENVIELLGVSWENGLLWLMMPLSTLGDLHMNLTSLRLLPTKDVKELTSKDKLNYALQIARGMNHIALKGMLHWNLATKHVLLFTGGTLKITGFGVKRESYFQDANGIIDNSHGINDFISTRWAAPEVLTDKSYTEYSDIWSYGVVLWEIETLGETPYSGIPIEDLYDQISDKKYRLPLPMNCHQETYSIMEKCWHSFPQKRPNFSAVLEDLAAIDL